MHSRFENLKPELEQKLNQFKFEEIDTNYFREVQNIIIEKVMLPFEYYIK